MKKFIALTVFLLAAFCSFSQTYVRGYTRSNGTYVQPHYRSSPNYTKADNWSTYGNVNPYTRAVGTRTYTNYNNSYYYYSTPSQTRTYTRRRY